MLLKCASIASLMCTGACAYVRLCMWCRRMHAVCVCSSKGAGSETLVNRTIIWRPHEDSQQPLSVCLPERPTLLLLLLLHGPAGKGWGIRLAVRAQMRFCVGVIMCVMHYLSESDILYNRQEIELCGNCRGHLNILKLKLFSNFPLIKLKNLTSPIPSLFRLHL